MYWLVTIISFIDFYTLQMVVAYFKAAGVNQAG